MTIVCERREIKHIPIKVLTMADEIILDGRLIKSINNDDTFNASDIEVAYGPPDIWEIEQGNLKKGSNNIKEMHCENCEKGEC